MPSPWIAEYYPAVRPAILVPGVGYPCLTAPSAASPTEQAPWDSLDLHA